jgi:hypothetical protein
MNGGIEIPKKLNRRQAIKQKCLDCSGYERNEVTYCRCKDCSLQPYRSGKGKQSPPDRDRAIREYCMWCTLDQPREISLCPATGCPLYEFRGFMRTQIRPNCSQKASSGAISLHDQSSTDPISPPPEDTHSGRLYMYDFKEEMRY